jgi:acyl-coenzyme A thioesterase PaaI-like protein
MTTPREELERTLATAPFAEIYGFVLVSIDDDSCTLRIPFRPVLERPGGIIAGPVYMAAADVSMMRRFPVSTRINSVVNDDEECSRPVEVAVTQNRLFA